MEERKGRHAQSGWTGNHHTPQTTELRTPPRTLPHLLEPDIAAAELWRAHHRTAQSTPTRALVRAVLGQACVDIQRQCACSTSKRRRVVCIRCDAAAWITGAPGRMTFALACETLDVEPARIRDALLTRTACVLARRAFVGPRTQNYSMRVGAPSKYQDNGKRRRRDNGNSRRF